MVTCCHEGRSRLTKHGIATTSLCFALFVGLFMLTVVGAGASQSVTVTTDKSSYSGNVKILVTGSISDTTGLLNVVLVVKNPAGSIVESSSAAADEDTGQYAAGFSAGGPQWSISGTYSITAIWQFGSQGLSNSTSFAYVVAGTTTSGAAITTSQAGTSTVANTAIQSSSAASTSSSGGGILELPYQALGMVSFTVLIVVSYALLRQKRK